MIELYGCKAEKIDPSIGAKRITELYSNSLNECKNTGLIPVIVALNDTLKETIEMNYNGFGGQIAFRDNMLSLDTSDGKLLFDKRYNDAMDMFDPEEFLEFDYDNDTPDCVHNYFAAGEALAYENDSELYIIYIPTNKPWEVFAWLPFGGWNDCPDTEQLLSMCRYWYESYNALPALITSDMLEFYLPHPITNKDIVEQIAKEQFAFCSELFVMGDELPTASLILNSNVWSFWWD